MFVVLFGTKNVGPIVDGLREYWGQRGFAVYPAMYEKVALNAAAAATHMLSRHTANSAPDTELVDAIMRWAERKHGDTFWWEIFKRDTDSILKEWREKNIPHFVLVYGVHNDREALFFKNSLRIKISDSSVDSSLCHMAFGEEDDTETIVKTIAEHCFQRIASTFDEQVGTLKGT